MCVYYIKNKKLKKKILKKEEISLIFNAQAINSKKKLKN